MGMIRGQGSVESLGKRLLVLLAAVLVLCLAGVPFARACSCMPSTFDEAVQERDLIAKITILGRQGQLKGDLNVAYDAKVERVWKGEQSRRITFRSAEYIASCGLGRISTGTTLLVWASGEDGDYSMTWCDIPDDVGPDPQGRLTEKLGEPVDLTDETVPFASHDLLPEKPLVTVGIALLGLAVVGHRLFTVVVLTIVLRRSRTRK